jgi:hypothetical protein
MRRRLAQGTTLALLLFASGAAAEGRPFDKPLLTSPVYGAVRTLERAGYFTGFPEGTFITPRTRYEFAVAVERLYRSIQPRVLSAVAPGTLPEDLRVLRRLLDEFAEDVGDLGHDVKEIQRQVDAMRDRVDRLPVEVIPEEAPRAPGGGKVEKRPAPVIAAPDGGRGFGFRPAFSRLEASLSPAGPDLFRPASAFAIKPGLAASLGPAILGLEIQPPDPLSYDARTPLQDPTAGMRFRAQLGMPVGSYLVSAFYTRDGGPLDRYAINSPLLAGFGPSETVGAQFSGTLFNPRLGFMLQGGSVSSLHDDLGRVLSLAGGFSYDLGSGFNVDLGYRMIRQLGLSGMADAGLVMGLGRRLGRNTRFDAIYRGGDNASTVTQITVKF